MKDWKQKMTSLMAVVAIMLAILFVFDPEVFFPPSEEINVSGGIGTSIDPEPVHIMTPQEAKAQMDAQMVDFTEENQDYLGTVNEGIQLEQLQNLNSLYSIRFINEESATYATAYATITGYVVAVEGRTITLASDNFSIYIGESAVIILYEGRGSSYVDTDEIRPGDRVTMETLLQYRRSDPLYVGYIALYHQ